MQPSIASFLCIIFIILVLIINYKPSPKVSNAIWIPTIWLMIIASRPVIQWLGLGSGDVSVENYFTGNPLDRNIFSLLIFLAIFVLLRRRKKFFAILGKNIWLILFILYCGISVVWSDYPLTALKRYFRGIGTVLVAFVVLTEEDPLEAIKKVIRTSAFILLPTSILLIKYYRHLGVAYGPWGGEAMNVGVATHKNTLGQLSLITGLYFYFQMLQDWSTRHITFNKFTFSTGFLYLLMAVWLLLKSNSATSLGCFLISILAIHSLRTSFFQHHRNIIGIILILFFIISLPLVLSFNIIEEIIAIFGRDTTLTDRVYIWRDVLQLVSNPWIGTGYDSFWLGERLNTMWEKWWFKPNETHNGYLDVYIELGYIGLFFLASFLLKTYANICKTFRENYDIGTLQLSYFIIMLLYNITEAAMKLRTTMFFIFLILTLLPLPSHASSKDATD